MIIDRTNGMIERWALDGLRRQVSVKIPFSGQIKSMTAGQSADGPLLLRIGATPDAFAPTEFVQVDPLSFRQIQLALDKTSNYQYGDNVHVRAGACGDVFTSWYFEEARTGLTLLVILKNRLFTKHDDVSIGFATPSANGMHFLSSRRGIQAAPIKSPSSEWESNGRPCIPTSHARYYLTIPSITYVPFHESFKEIPNQLYVVSSHRPLMNLPSLDLGERPVGPPSKFTDFTAEKRVYYLTQANLLISIPIDNRRLVVQSFDFDVELSQNADSYLLVSSVPGRFFLTRKNYLYQVTAESKAKGVRFRLVEAPEGMKNSPTGRITWNVPAKFEPDRATVSVGVSDASEQEVHDTFVIYRAK